MPTLVKLQVVNAAKKFPLDVPGSKTLTRLIVKVTRSGAYSLRECGAHRVGPGTYRCSAAQLRRVRPLLEGIIAAAEFSRQFAREVGDPRRLQVRFEEAPK